MAYRVTCKNLDEIYCADDVRDRGNTLELTFRGLFKEDKVLLDKTSCGSITVEKKLWC